MPRGRDLVFVGDVHLDRDDPDLGAFVAYLQGLAATAGRIVLLGDLFNLWIGDPELEQEHHRAVVRCLRDLRGRGMDIHYIEGNRDYRIAAAHLGSTFDAVSDNGLVEDWSGRRLFAAHGDLVNVRDVQYRSWRRLSRSATAWWAFSRIPRGKRFAIAESIERKMRATNTGMKREFPESHVLDCAARQLGEGAGAVVLGHFHVEKELRLPGAHDRRVFVLPEWKGSRRHLRVSADGTIAFENARPT